MQYQNVASNQVSFKITEKHYQQSMRLHFKRRGLVTAGLIMLACVISLALVDLALASSTLLFFVVYFAFLMWVMRRNIRKTYKSMPQLHVEQTMQFSEEGLVLHNAYALSKVKWQLFQKFDVDENMYLLYQGPNLFNMIPRSAFESEEQESAFRMMLELNVHPAKRRRRPAR